jgi:type I restriction enzyme S subunit
MFIRATNIKKGRIITNDMKYISQQEADKIRKCKLNGDEIIIVRSGVNTGDTCVINKDYEDQYAGYDLIIELKRKILNPMFLNELWNTNYMMAIVKPLTRRAAQPHLNSDQVKSLKIPLPPINLQDQFAEFVIKIEEQKDLVKKAIDESQCLFNSLMNKFFE